MALDGAYIFPVEKSCGKTGSNQKMPVGCSVGTVGSIPETKTIAYVSVESLEDPFKPIQHESNTVLHAAPSAIGSPAFRSPATTGAPHTVRSGLV